MHFKETVTSAGSKDTLRKNVGVRARQGQRSVNVHNVERNIMDSVGYGATHHPTEIHRNEDGKETEKERQVNPERWKIQSRKWRNQGKRKAEERKDNVSKKSQNHQMNSGQVDLGTMA